MGLKINLRFKGIRRLKRFLTVKNGGRRRKSSAAKRVCSWMVHVSHGHHVVQLDDPWRSVSAGNDYTTTRSVDDSVVVVQREQIQGCELWFFGVFDDGRIGEGVTKYMQSHFFDKMHSKQIQSQIRKKSKSAMERAHLNARAKHRDNYQPSLGPGSATALVINGDKLVMANMGNYKAVVCRDGEAYQICGKKQYNTTHWSLRLISGALRVQKRRCESELVVGSERIDSETEFVILASTGIWEVMRHQEAVNLIRHIEDPQAAAECLATEALIRMSKSFISCLIIRFD